jgi:hypothetical protein
MYLSKCIIERSRVSASFPRALSFFLLLQRRDTNNELSFCITSSFPLPTATESFPSNLSRSECLSKPLRSVRFEPYFPSSVSPRRLEYASMNLRQSGFPLNTCSLGISDGQHVFSKPLFPSTSIIAVSIRSFTEKSVCASSFSKVALEASFFFVFVFVVKVLS